MHAPSQIKQDILDTCADVEVFKLVAVHTRTFKTALRRQAQALSCVVLNAVRQRMQAKAQAVNQRYTAMAVSLQKTPANTEELTKLNEYAIQCIAEVARLHLEVTGRDGVVRHASFLLEHDYTLNTSTIFMLKEMLDWPPKIHREQEHCEAMMNVSKTRMIVDLEAQQRIFDKEIHVCTHHLVCLPHPF